MRLTQIRNATVMIEYGGKKILIDPMLAKQASYPPFRGTINQHLNNPLVELPLPLEVILDVDLIIVTHTHLDHWDSAAEQLIDKQQLIMVANQSDYDKLSQVGFTNLQLLQACQHFAGINLIKTSGQHGHPPAADRLGEVCGIVLQHCNEKTLYIAGDTIFYSEIARQLIEYQPQIVLLNCGDAQIIGLGSIIMDQHDVLEVCRVLPEAKIIASHMEAVNHATLSRNALKQFVQQHQLSQQVYIPADGESYQF